MEIERETYDGDIPMGSYHITRLNQAILLLQRDLRGYRRALRDLGDK